MIVVVYTHVCYLLYLDRLKRIKISESSREINKCVFDRLEEKGVKNWHCVAVD